MMLRDKAGGLSEIIAIFCQLRREYTTINQSIPTGGAPWSPFRPRPAISAARSRRRTQKIAERKGVIKAGLRRGINHACISILRTTEIVFGAGSVSELPELLREAEAFRACSVVYGGSRARKSGLLDRVFQLLEEAGVSYQTLGGVQPKPRVALARGAWKLALSLARSSLLAVGGGSVIDTCKAIAARRGHPGDGPVGFWQTARGC